MLQLIKLLQGKHCVFWNRIIYANNLNQWYRGRGGGKLHKNINDIDKTDEIC